MSRYREIPPRPTNAWLISNMGKGAALADKLASKKKELEEITKRMTDEIDSLTFQVEDLGNITEVFRGVAISVVRGTYYDKRGFIEVRPVADEIRRSRKARDEEHRSGYGYKCVEYEGKKSLGWAGQYRWLGHMGSKDEFLGFCWKPKEVEYALKIWVVEARKLTLEQAQKEIEGEAT